MKGYSFFLCVGLLAFLPASSQRNKQTSTGKSELVPETTVLSIAAEQYRTFLAANIILESTVYNELIQKVGNRVIAAAKAYYTQKKRTAELKDFQWEIKLVDRKEINTWCLPGGRIVVCAGLLTFTQNEASLAVALSHQIAHTLVKHGNERMKRSLQELMGGKSLPEVLSAKPADAKDLYQIAYAMGNHIGAMPPFTQDEEMEADELGLMFTGLAGYNPREALVFWQRMSLLSRGPRKPELLSVHLVDEERMAEMDKNMDDMVKNYYKPLPKTGK